MLKSQRGEGKPGGPSSDPMDTLGDLGDGM